MKKILILAGGYSKEKEVSIKTAKSVYSELNKDRKYKINSSNKIKYKFHWSNRFLNNIFNR